MPTHSTVELVSALARGAFEEIIGTTEGRELDFKSAPYAVDTAKGKWELAKDVAAFANASGGYLLLGVRTEQEVHHVAEVASELRPIPKDRVKVSQYRDLLTEWIKPIVENVDFRWFPDDADTDGLLLIRVPPQRASAQPFLVAKVVDADGETVPAFAWPVRNEDRIEWVRVDRVQHQLNLAQTFAERMTAATLIKDRESVQTAELRATELRKTAGCADEACLVIQAQPPGPVDLLPKMYGAAGLIEAIGKWKGIRNMGFDLETHASPEPENGHVLFGGSRWKARVDTDGWCQVAIPARHEFLGWASRRGDNPSLNTRVNSVVLVEFVYDFFRLVRQLVAPLAAPGAWTGRVRAWDMKKAQVELHPGRLRSRLDWDSPRTASTDDYGQTFPCTGPATHDAFECLVRIYALWGLGPDSIPFSREDAVLPEEIISLRT